MRIVKQYPLELRFIGEDGSMGLEHGRIYDVWLYLGRGWLWVEWKPCPPWPTTGEPFNRCPYASLEAFAQNWALPYARRKEKHNGF